MGQARAWQQDEGQDVTIVHFVHGGKNVMNHGGGEGMEAVPRVGESVVITHADGKSTAWTVRNVTWRLREFDTIPQAYGYVEVEL